MVVYKISPFLDLKDLAIFRYIRSYQYQIYKTRLISIVSKPIKVGVVAVVIAVVVFAKKN